MTATQISGTSRRSYEAVLKYYDKKTDTAVLKIEGKGFESFGLLTRSVRVGERVYAIGNPRGLEQSISEGIVSGIREDDGALWIQHSAAIAPGSSGGALISSRGELLGINSWFVKESQGLNFAVPASTLASAYSGARDLQGSLRFPGSPPVSQAQALPPASPDQEPSLPAPPLPSIPEQRPPAKPRTNEPVPHAPGTDPTERPEDAVLRRARESSAAFRDSLPNYVCQEFITRYSSTSHIVSWQARGVVSIELVYENGREQYRNVSINDEPTERGFEELPGSWSVLADVFSPSTAADFHYRRESRAGGRSAMVYDFTVEREHSHWKIMSASRMMMSSYRSSVWIDEETNRVLRIEMQATHLQQAFLLDKVESATDYEFVRFAEGLFLVPVHAETLNCERGTDNCERNTIDFRNYLRYSGEAATGPPPGQNPPNPAEQLVRLNVTVSDKFGRRITDLPQSAFTVLENGTPQQIRIFKLEEVPVSMGLIIDSSGNMRDQRRAVESSALSLVRNLIPQDEVFIVNFNDEAFLDTNFTNDVKDLQEGLTRIDSRGGSAMRDAIRKSIDYMKEKAKRDKKVLVVVTDGNDNSSLISLEDLVKASQDSGVLIYSVGLLSEKGRTKEAAKAKRALNLLVEGTGGQGFYPKDLAEIERVTHEVELDFRSQYTITYTPASQKLDGSFRTISVIVKGPGSPVARTRQGYYATKDRL